MRFRVLFLFTLFILPCLSASQEVANPQHIEAKSDSLFELTETNFDQTVLLGDDKKWFVMFYVHWCPHCQKAMPVFEEFANYPNDQVSIARVDCDVNPGLKDRYSVQKYPTLILFYKGKLYQYEGPKTIEAWSKFVNQDFQNIESQETLVDLNQDNFNSKIFANEGNKWMVMFYAPWCGYSKNAMPVFTELSKTIKEDTSFGRVDCEANPEFKSRFTINRYPTFLFFSNGEIRKVEGPRTVEAWSDFVSGGYKQITAVEENIHSISYIEPAQNEIKIFGMPVFALIIGGCIIALILLASIIVVSYRKNKDNTVHFQLKDTTTEDERRNDKREIEISPVFAR